MRTIEEIQEQIDRLDDKILLLKENKEKKGENFSNESQIVLIGSELESITLTSVLDQDEETVEGLLKKFEERRKILNRDYLTAHKYNQEQKKTELHSMIWVNDIRVDTYKWVLDVKEEKI